MSSAEPPPLPGATANEPPPIPLGLLTGPPAMPSAGSVEEAVTAELARGTSSPAPASSTRPVNEPPSSTVVTHPDRAHTGRFPSDVRAQVIDSEVIEMATPSAEHGNAQAGIVTCLRRIFHRRVGGELPGGWWLMTEVEIEFEPDQLFIPDVVGWRRSYSTVPPTGRPMTTRPDWVCEVVSPATAYDDLVKKLRVFQRSSVRYYWTVDLTHETLTVLRWTPEGYLIALTAGRGDRVRAEPFDAVEIPVGVLFGDDEE